MEYSRAERIIAGLEDFQQGCSDVAEFFRELWDSIVDAVIADGEPAVGLLLDGITVAKVEAKHNAQVAKVRLEYLAILDGIIRQPDSTQEFCDAVIARRRLEEAC